MRSFTYTSHQQRVIFGADSLHMLKSEIEALGLSSRAELIEQTVPPAIRLNRALDLPGASAAVAHKLGLVDAKLTVHMPGGQIVIEIARDFAIKMIGPTTRVAEGRLDAELFSIKV